MSTRALAARLAKIAVPPGLVPRCIHHGTLCRMGADWPQKDPMADVRALLRQPGDVDPYTVHKHVAMTPEQCAQDDRELAELIADLEAKNERTLARIRADYDEPL